MPKVRRLKLACNRLSHVDLPWKCSRSHLPCGLEISSATELTTAQGGLTPGIHYTRSNFFIKGDEVTTSTITGSIFSPRDVKNTLIEFNNELPDFLHTPAHLTLARLTLHNASLNSTHLQSYTRNPPENNSSILSNPAVFKHGKLLRVRSATLGRDESTTIKTR